MPGFLLSGLLFGDQGLIDYTSTEVMYSIGLTLFGALSLYGAVKVWKHWRMGVGILWLIFGIGCLREGLRLVGDAFSVEMTCLIATGPPKKANRDLEVWGVETVSRLGVDMLGHRVYHVGASVFKRLNGEPLEKMG